MIPAAWVCSFALVAQPPASPQRPIEAPQNRSPPQVAPTSPPPSMMNSGGAPPANIFSTGVFPFGATMATVDPNGGVSIDLIYSETVMETATRTVTQQGPDGRTQYKTEQYVLPKSVYKMVRRALPPNVKLFRNGRELSAQEKASLTQPTPIFIAMLGVPDGPVTRGYEKVVGDALVAFIPHQGVGIPATGNSPGTTTPGRASVPVMTPPGTGASSTSPSSTPELSRIEKEAVENANEARKTAGLTALKIHPTLVKAARQHSAKMARVGKLEHVLDGKGPQERVTDLGLRPTFTGENCAQGQQTGAEAVESWMSSPGHRANILNPAFTHIGVGKADGENGPYWTQVFVRME